jgi:nitroimidazol reductase NimA-like FMN-containing flavoprotein (pyridoxamine 5'-phosphate oxidase superfamily)
MFDAAAREFLQKTLIARLAVIDPEGYPHVVPVWFMLDGDDIVFITERGTRKVQHALHIPKGAVVIGGDSGDGAGYLIKGDLSLEEDPDRYWTRTLTYRYEEEAQAARDVAAWAVLDMVILRLRARRVIKVM